MKHFIADIIYKRVFWKKFNAEIHLMQLGYTRIVCKQVPPAHWRKVSLFSHLQPLQRLTLYSQSSSPPSPSPEPTRTHNGCGN